MEPNDKDYVREIKQRIAWINDHEKMFMLSPILELEREFLLAQLDPEEQTDVRNSPEE